MYKYYEMKKLAKPTNQESIQLTRKILESLMIYVLAKFL